MKYKLFAFIFLSFFFSVTNASNDEKCFEDSKSLITNLYKNYPVVGNKIIESADRKTISRFFSNQLTNMLVKDYACRSNLNGVCNIDFNILSNAQDDIGKFSILQATDNIVTVKFNTPTHGEFIDFLIENKGVRVSKHCVSEEQYRKNNIIDLGTNSNGFGTNSHLNAQGKKFKQACKDAKLNGIISGFISGDEPGEGAMHIEITQ